MANDLVPNTHTPMNQFGRARRRAFGKVMGLHQDNLEAAHCCIDRGAQASGATANDGQVVLVHTGQARHQLRSVRLQRLHSNASLIQSCAQARERATAWRQRAMPASRSANEICGTKRLSSAHCAEISAALAQKPVAKPAK